MILQVIINGYKKELDSYIGESLADCLKRNGHVEVRTGCDTGSCGLCTIWLDGTPILSCSTLAARADGCEVTTILGLKEEASELSKYLIEEGADQCGFCSPGFIMTALAMKNELKTVTKESINDYMAGNLCRCTGYEGQTRGLLRWLKEDSHVLDR